MPRENLHSPKRSDKAITDVVDYGISRITSWTKKELADLQKTSKLPICVALQNGDYLVATYKIVKQSDARWFVNELEFIDKRSAIFYCALMHVGKKPEARKLYELDQKVNRLDVDKTMFRTKLDDAHKTPNQFKIDLYSSRYTEIKQHLIHARRELEKRINSAKYH